MDAFSSPIGNSIWLVLTSSPALSSKATAIVSLIIDPLLEVLLLIALLTSVGVTTGTQVRDAAYAATILAIGLSVMSGAVASTTHDRQLGVAHTAIADGLRNPAFWAGKLIAPMLTRLLPAIFGVLGVYWAIGDGNTALLVRALWLIPVAAFVGALVGIAAAIASLGLSDPYLVSNISRAILLITAGVVVPLRYYPSWLATVARFLPFTALIEAVRADGGVWLLLLRELGVSAVWLTVGLLLARWVLDRIRSGDRAEQIW